MAGLLAMVFVFVQLPSGNRFWAAVQNAGHGLAFAALTSVALFLLSGRNGLPRREVMAVLVGLSLLGLSIEIGQAAVGRGASLLDIVMNTCGIAAGASLFGCVTALPPLRRDTGTRPSGVSRARAWVLGVTALSLSAWCVREPAYILLAEALTPSLPLLADFESLTAQRNIVSRGANARVERSAPRWTSNPSRVLAVEFAAGRHSTVGLLDVETDWTGYRYLTIGVYSDEKEAFELSIRLDLIGNDERGRRKRLYHRASVEAGENVVRVDLHELLGRDDDSLADGNAGELNVKSIYLFVSRSDRDRSVLLDDLRLE